MKAFNKGEAVTLVGSWDNKGTFYFTQAVVYSCGTKQMVLTCAESGAELGRHYFPQVGNVDTLHAFNWRATFKRMTDEEANALCLELGAKLPAVFAAENARREQHNEKIGYVTLCALRLDELHEPRCFRRMGPTP